MSAPAAAPCREGGPRAVTAGQNNFTTRLKAPSGARRHMDAGCNDPRCPLNRRGVPHRPHEDIEHDDVLDPCNDPRCALTRLGMRHNSHGPMDGPDPGAGSGAGGQGPGPSPGRDADRDADRSQGGSRATRGGTAGGPQPAGSSTSPEEILDEAARHLRQRAAGIGAAGRPGKGPAEDERILGATDPHGILGIPRGATIAQAKSRYKSLVKRYDAARGIINKSAPEREKSNLIMAKINGAFEAFKTSRGRPR